MRNIFSYIAVVMVATVILFGCSMSKGLKTFGNPIAVKLYFQAENHINEGILLPVDVITVEGELAKEVLEIGPEKWFGHATRDKLLESELHTLALSGGGKRKLRVKLKPTVKYVIIYADYEERKDPEGQQIVIDLKKWHYTYKINIQGKNMELKS